MKKSQVLKIAIFLSLWISGDCSLGLSMVMAAEKIVILHTSEHHGAAPPLNEDEKGRVGGMSRRARMIEDIGREGPPVLVLDSGDILIGTAMSSWFRGLPDIEAMNLMRYDGMVAGNHDFDFGLEHLGKLTDLADFPILCTNLQSSEMVLPCRRSFVTRLGRVIVGVLGIVGHSNFPETFNRDVVPLLSMVDSLKAIREESFRLRERFHADVILLLTHQNTEEDLALLKKIPFVDVIIGGHTLGFDGMYVPGRSAPISHAISPDRVFVKTHRQGRTLGRLDLTIEGGKIIEAQADNIPVTKGIPEDPGVLHLLQDYWSQFRTQATEVIGESQVRLLGERPVVRTQESNFGNLLADHIRRTLDVDVALLNSGQIRGSLEKGPVTLGEVLVVLPFDSSLVTLEVTGAVLRQIMEHSVSQWPNHSGRFLQVSGLRVKYDPSKAIGSRVETLMVGEHPVDPLRTYLVATDAFLADGGDGYTHLSQSTGRIDHPTLVRDVLLKALAAAPLYALTDHRIQFVKPSSPS